MSSTLNESSLNTETPNWHSGLSPYPSEFVQKPKNVHVCYGCGTNFTEKYSSEPNNVIIKHIDRRTRGKGSDGRLLYNADFTPNYYHPIRSHVSRKNPLFTGTIKVKHTVIDKIGYILLEIM